MAILTVDSVEGRIVNAVEEVRKKFKLNATVDGAFCPGTLIPSQVLLTIMNTLCKVLEVNMPESCYIFHDKKTNRQLSINEAADKLIKAVKGNGK